MINGNTAGIRESLLQELELLYEIKGNGQEFCAYELLNKLAEYTEVLNREISVYLSRNGRVLDVSVGESTSVQMPYIRKRRGTLGLSGVRCIHTHPSGHAMLSEVDIGTLLSSRLDAMAAVAVKEGKARGMVVGMIGESLKTPVLYGPFYGERVPQKPLMDEIDRATRRVADLIRLDETKEQTERAMLIGLNSTQESMEELKLLSDTAGAEVVYAEVQKRERDHFSYIGKGKAKELALIASANDVDLAIVNDELTPGEEKNLEEILGLKVLDRTALILDIFAQRAKTREGKLQVELAQMKYMLPRLQGEGVALSRLGGGIGTRGPGEKKIETDRRRIRRRIFELEKEIQEIVKDRDLRRANREKNRIKELALVGYTNAGKSTLLNTLSDAGVYADDRLFATLDTVTRRVSLPDGEVLVTDTVGFIEKLPHDLVSAFKSTLEEAKRADLLLIVLDVSSTECENHRNVVQEVLESLGASDIPKLYVYNKADRLDVVPNNTEKAVFISAKSGEGVPSLLAQVQEMLKPKTKKVVLKLGYDEGAKLASITKYAETMHTEYLEDHMIVTAELPVDIKIL